MQINGVVESQRYPKIAPLKVADTFTDFFVALRQGQLCRQTRHLQSRDALSVITLCLCIAERREWYQSTQLDELYTKIYITNNFTDCARFYENEQTAREVYEKMCFVRK